METSYALVPGHSSKASFDTRNRRHWLSEFLARSVPTHERLEICRWLSEANRPRTRGLDVTIVAAPSIRHKRWRQSTTADWLSLTHHLFSSWSA